LTRCCSQDQNLIRLFPSTCDWIARAIASGGTVLVHCSGGIALAPSIVCGFVMFSQRWTFEEAVRWTQQRRYCMSLNIVRSLLFPLLALGWAWTLTVPSPLIIRHQGFLNQLREYEAFCRASIALPPPSAEPHQPVEPDASRLRKRTGDTLYEADDDDDEMTGEGGDDDEGGRPGAYGREEGELSIDPATGRPEHRPVRRVQRLVL
jgi:hypothetical protein